jgi:hypothetical protein
MGRMESVTEVTCYYRAFVPLVPEFSSAGGRDGKP